MSAAEEEPVPGVDGPSRVLALESAWRDLNRARESLARAGSRACLGLVREAVPVLYDELVAARELP